MGYCGPGQFIAYFFFGSLIFFILTLPTVCLLFIGIVCQSKEQRLLNSSTCELIPSNHVSYILLGVGAALCIPNLIFVFFCLRCFCANPDEKDTKRKLGNKVEPLDDDDDEADETVNKDTPQVFYAEDIIKMKAESNSPENTPSIQG